MSCQDTCGLSFFQWQQIFPLPPNVLAVTLNLLFVIPSSHRNNGLGEGESSKIPPHCPTLTRLYWGNRGILTQSMMRTEVGGGKRVSEINPEVWWGKIWCDKTSCFSVLSRNTHIYTHPRIFRKPPPQTHTHTYTHRQRQKDP